MWLKVSQWVNLLVSLEGELYPPQFLSICCIDHLALVGIAAIHKAVIFFLCNFYTLLHIRHFFQPKNTDIFLFLHKNICCGYSAEVPQWGTSDEYPQHRFTFRSKKNIKQILSLIWSYGTSPTIHAHKWLDKVLRPGTWLCTRMTTFNFPFTELSTLTIYLFLLNKSQTKATFW